MRSDAEHDPALVYFMLFVVPRHSSIASAAFASVLIVDRLRGEQFRFYCSRY